MTKVDKLGCSPDCLTLYTSFKPLFEYYTNLSDGRRCITPTGGTVAHSLYTYPTDLTQSPKLPVPEASHSLLQRICLSKESTEPYRKRSEQQLVLGPTSSKRSPIVTSGHPRSLPGMKTQILCGISPLPTSVLHEDPTRKHARCKQTIDHAQKTSA